MHNYIAFGLTQTSNMGDASVIECVQSSPGIVSAFTSWNYLRDVSRQDIVRMFFIIGKLIEFKFPGSIYNSFE